METYQWTKTPPFLPSFPFLRPDSIHDPVLSNSPSKFSSSTSSTSMLRWSYFSQSSKSLKSYFSTETTCVIPVFSRALLRLKVNILFEGQLSATYPRTQHGAELEKTYLKTSVLVITCERWLSFRDSSLRIIKMYLPSNVEILIAWYTGERHVRRGRSIIQFGRIRGKFRRMILLLVGVLAC